MAIKVIIAFLLLISVVQANLTCESVLETVSPCEQHVPPGGPVSPSCCTALRKLRELSVTPSDAKVGCRCIRAALLTRAPKEVLRIVSSLASLCGVELPYKLGPAAEC